MARTLVRFAVFISLLLITSATCAQPRALATSWAEMIDVPSRPGSAQPQSPAFTGIPRMARRGDYVYVAWGDGGDPNATEVLLARPSVEELR